MEQFLPNSEPFQGMPRTRLEPHGCNPYHPLPSPSQSPPVSARATPLTSGPLGVHTHAFFLGCSCQLGLSSQRPGQGQQPRSPSAHQASWAWGERCRGGVGQRLELILLLKGERMARGSRGWGPGCVEGE